TANAVILQPEGTTFVAEDFAGPPGPSNPLAAAVRAASEYISEAAARNGTKESPYPLLLVRPDGIPAYLLARQALASWRDEHGYELIEDDWQLDYPAADRSLAQVERLTLDDARMRMARLMRAAPRS